MNKPVWYSVTVGFFALLKGLPGLFPEVSKNPAEARGEMAAKHVAKLDASEIRGQKDTSPKDVYFERWSHISECNPLVLIL